MQIYHAVVDLHGCLAFLDQALKKRRCRSASLTGPKSDDSPRNRICLAPLRCLL